MLDVLTGGLGSHSALCLCFFLAVLRFSVDLWSLDRTLRDDMAEQPLLDAGASKVITLEQETGFAANGIVSRTLLRTENGRAVLFGFSEGQELTEHTTTQHATVHILTGECEFDLGKETHNLKAGDYLHMPPGLPHAVRAKTQFSMLLTLIKP
jgi:quercetin dioxygenase-like cupin family protein